jgi:hypothetical protein
MSGFALLLSFSTAYFNFFRISDDLSVAIGRVHGVSIDENTNKLRIAGNTDLTFINSGNRAAAVSRVTYIISRDAPALRTCSMDFNSRYFFFQSSPFVVGPGQLVVQTFDKRDTEGSLGWEPMIESTDAEIADTEELKLGESVAICLRIAVTTPDAEGYRVVIPIHKQVLYRTRRQDEPPRAIAIDPMYLMEKPVPLMKSSRIHFLN